jgi:DedD protein
VVRVVKERLIGAAVLMAAAVILVPEMLTGQKRAETPEQQSEAQFAAVHEGRPDAPIKTYTIDLKQPSGSPQAASQTPTSQPPAPGTDDARAPEPEKVPLEADDRPASAAAASGPKPAGTFAVAPAGARVAAAPGPSAPVPATSTASSAPSIPAPKAAAPAPAPGGAVQPAAGAAASSARQATTAPGTAPGGGWAVQVGSFSKHETARQLAEQLRARGHESFVMPVQAKGSTLYRVRVGPMQDRAGAEAKARQLKASGTSTGAAAVVPHP